MKSFNDIIIGIDTSCYTTSIAAISINGEVLFNERILLDVAKNSNGLRQSEAIFKHINNLGVISDKIKEKLKNKTIKAICVSKAPRPLENSYMPVFNVGYNFSKLLSSTHNSYLYTTTHQENHIKAGLFTNKLKNKNKFLAFHMSGGTTEILLIERENNLDEKYIIKIVGGTKDISFGQLIDRVGVKLCYDFPCGKYIDFGAINCSKKIEKGLKTSVNQGYMNISGLENQIVKVIDKYDKNYISKLTLDAIIRNIEKSLSYICNEYNIKEVLFVGGVSSSTYIRENLKKRIKTHIDLYFTNPEYSTDNAIGCALIGLDKYKNKYEIT